MSAAPPPYTSTEERLQQEYGNIVSKGAIAQFVYDGDRLNQHKEERDPQCDVCGFTDECGQGGRALWDTDDGWTLICESCWSEFTNVDESKGEKRKINDKVGRCVALRLGLALDPQKMVHTLSSDSSFVNNSFRFRQIHRSGMSMLRDTVLGTADTGAVGIVRDFTSRAEAEKTQCMFVCPSCVPAHSVPKLFVCTACRLVHYCSRDCQRSDRRRHAPFCLAHPYTVPKSGKEAAASGRDAIGNVCDIAKAEAKANVG
jgi:hypothetical protein